ncbi:MAG TPA: mandelate racemase/muconate lactonizing enzyme family protein [Kiritimatiellia bacterium]|nr:mandelate racemase/muconate lactonizing enzyme family protein [Kiritimatiellia bacterium]
MKITGIKTFVCHAYRTNWVFVKVLTDEAGLYGVGEATLEYKEATIVSACQDLERDMLGKDPRDIEAIWHSNYRDAYWRGGPVLMSAISAIDIALWDILGKSLGVPVWRLLGGRVRDKVPCYANAWFAGAKEPEEFAEKAAEAIETAGWKGLKWDPFGTAYRQLEPQAFRKAMRCIEMVYEAVDGRAEILIEGHGRFDLPTALRIANALEAFNILWFEESIIPDTIEAIADLRSRVKVPLSFGERLYNTWQFRTLLEARGADFVQPDVSHAGGITELRKIAAIAESHHIPFCPHNPSGPVANAATLQLAASQPGFYLLETMANDVPWRRDVCDEAVTLHDGEMHIPADRPGIGVDINEAAIAKHPYQPISLRHYKGTLTEIRPADATAFFN